MNKLCQTLMRFLFEKASLREIFKRFESSVTYYDYKINELDTLLYHSRQILMIE